MVAAVKQIVTVGAGGEIRLRSKELKAGDEAEVIVLVPDRITRRNRKHSKSAPRIKLKQNTSIAKMTKQTRGDIAWAEKIMSDPNEKPVPYAVARKRMGLA